jgi:hypothetical protein
MCFLKCSRQDDYQTRSGLSEEGNMGLAEIIFLVVAGAVVHLLIRLIRGKGGG